MKNSLIIEDIGKMYKLFNNPTDKILDVFGLSKFIFWRERPFKEFWALRGINLEIGQGERIGIIGRNGAGKSTLLKIISGNIAQTEGTIKVNGKIQALMQLGTGFHPEFTGRENIRASLSYNGISSKNIKQLEEEIIDFSELEDFIEQPVKVYSSGMYSRLAFAVSTVLEPDILIIDEVLGAGDASFITKCAQRIKRLTHDTGATVLFVSHSMDSVLEICDKAILLEKGQITHQGNSLEVSKIYNKKIREEDELYLKAKEYKLRKRDIKLINNSNQEYHVLLFRFVVAKEHPAKSHKIYRCAVSCHDKELASIDVGSPMDNDPTTLNRIIDGPGLMDWGNCKKDKTGFFRYYQNEAGTNCHAPFQLAVSRFTEYQNLSIDIDAEVDPQEEVLLDLWMGNEYKRIGILKGDQKTSKFSLPDINDIYQTEKEKEIETDLLDNEVKTESDEFSYEKLKESNSIYGTQEITINNIDIVDENKKSKRVFFVGENLTFKLEIESNEKDIREFVLCASILTTTGKPVGQVICCSSDIGLNSFKGKKTVELCFQPCRLGEDEYMVSFGVFKEYDLTTQRENESLCVADRAVFFKVLQPENVKKGLGAFAHSCKWIQGEWISEYDASRHYQQS